MFILLLMLQNYFIKRPKSHKNQFSTWPNYKNHDTIKCLAAAVPNSSTIFVSKAHCGSISDKKLTSKCKYLNKFDPYCQLMAEKRFSIPDYCTVRSIELIIPPGNRGKNKMLPKYISYKTA